MSEPTCVICGCTDSRACPDGCFWALGGDGGKTGPDVCSRCALDGLFGRALALAEEPRFLFAADVIARASELDTSAGEAALAELMGATQLDPLEPLSALDGPQLIRPGDPGWEEFDV